MRGEELVLGQCACEPVYTDRTCCVLSITSVVEAAMERIAFACACEMSISLRIMLHTLPSCWSGSQEVVVRPSCGHDSLPTYINTR
jgi:hypothetical protein